jgi:BirA family biotin operon repressor/biotin-[acetyl-CoA-carboxylase] ligase
MTLPTPEARWTLTTKHVGRQVAVYERLASTNTLALSVAADVEQGGAVFIAREQTAGRGQYGRSWQAPPESSVLMSVLLFPPVALRRPVLLTAWAAVSVCDAILQLVNLQAKIKWPNDVLIRGKKVCGILIEQRTTANPDFPLATVVGVGLNVTQTAAMFQQAGLPDAASLASLSGQSPGYEDVAKALIGQLDAQYAGMFDGDLHTLESLWKWRLGLLGKFVIARGPNDQYCGRLLDVTFAGLDLELEGGALVRLPPEGIRNIDVVEG